MSKFYDFSRYLFNHRVVRFIFAGGTAAVTNLSVLFVLVEFFHVWYLLAAVISFVVAFYVSFVMQKFLTFNDYGKEKIRQQLALYFGIQIFNLCLNTLLMYISVEIFGLHYLISQILIAGGMAVYNFFIYKYVVFEQNIVQDKNQPKVPCPSCGQIENKIWGSKNGYTLIRCDLCCLIFVSPMPSDTADIYQKEYFTGGGDYGYVDYDRDKEPMRRTFELYLKHMEQVLGRKGRLLDIGAATGFFMDIARHRGWEVEGIEISAHAASIGKSKGLNIHTGTLESANLPGKSFDAITFFDVIEHLRDPKSAILTAKPLLKNGGIIVVNTPDTGSLWARVLGKRWQLVVPPEHLILFNRNNFADLLNRVGLKPILVKNIGKYFSIPYIFQTLYHWQGLGIWNILARITNKGFLARLQIPINLRDNFFMIAKN